jgi:predicted MFS family arabinose efflux permease
MFFSRVFIPFALGYFISQLFRSVIAVVSADLIRELSLDAWTVGFLTSAYFLAFAAAQLPVGIALDRFGPRRTESALLLFAAVGSVVFATADSASGLALGRALIGFGVSACLMASFHAFVLWAPADRLQFLNGSVMAVGAAGALTATVPVEWAAASIGWRNLFLVLAFAAVLCAVVIFSSVPEKTRARDAERLSEVTRGVARVFKNKAFWSIAPFSVAHQGAYLSLQSLWAGPWLRDVAGLERHAVASHLLTLALAMGIGFISLGALARHLGRRGVSALAIWVVSALLFQATQIGLVLEWTDHARLLWVGFGLFGAAGMLSYVILNRGYPVEMAGRVNTGLNVFVFAGAFALQAGVGAVIEHYTPDGASFSPRGFQLAFALVLAIQLASVVWLVLTSSWRTPHASDTLRHEGP